MSVNGSSGTKVQNGLVEVYSISHKPFICLEQDRTLMSVRQEGVGASSRRGPNRDVASRVLPRSPFVTSTLSSGVPLTKERTRGPRKSERSESVN